MLSPFASPRRCRKGSKDIKSPYLNQGLDKFSELDEKRQRIYSKRLDSDGPSLVRFVFTGSGECVPVFIKTKKSGKRCKENRAKTEKCIDQESEEDFETE